MKIIAQAAPLLSIPTPVLVIGLFAEKTLTPQQQEINTVLGDVLEQALREQEDPLHIAGELLCSACRRRRTS